MIIKATFPGFLEWPLYIFTYADVPYEIMSMKGVTIHSVEEPPDLSGLRVVLIVFCVLLCRQLIFFLYVFCIVLSVFLQY